MENLLLFIILLFSVKSEMFLVDKNSYLNLKNNTFVSGNHTILKYDSDPVV